MLLTPFALAQQTPQMLQAGHEVPAPNDRLHIHREQELLITTAVPSAAETRKIFGANLYTRNIQPVWVKIENLGNDYLYLTPMGLDPGHYTPQETANRSRFELKLDRKTLFEQFERKVAPLVVAPTSVQSGYIFSRVDEGTKSFNVDVIGSERPYRATFFVPVPGLRLDHYTVDMEALHSPEEIRNVSAAQLAEVLEEMPCCVTDRKGKSDGDPLNLVLIGDIDDVYYSFMRAGWDETETIYSGSLLKTVASAIGGGNYRYSLVSALYVFGRAQDAALQRARTSIHERNHLRIWLTPLRFEGLPVWIGQISRDIGVHLTWKTIITHKIDPDVDETREFLVEDLAYAQSLRGFGYVGGVGAADYDSRRGNQTGDPYFTDGRRVVLWISGTSTSIDDIRTLDLTKD